MPAPATSQPAETIFAERLLREVPPLIPGPRSWLVAIAAAALAARLTLAWQPVDTLAAKLTPDDAYYYFELARNVVRGHGPSLDGVNATNGFHPLWLALLLPLAALGREAFLHAALTLGAVIGMASVVALWWALAPLTQRLTVRIVATSFYAFNTAVLFSAANGMESSISLLCMIILFGLFLRSKAKSSTHYHYWVLLGAVGGLAVLARTDNGLFVLAMLAFLVPQRGIDLRPALVAGIAAAAVTLPWFAWNLAVFGTPLQASAEAPALALHASFDPDGSRPLTDVLSHSAGQVKQVFLNEIPRTYFFAKPVLGTLVSVLIAGSAVAALRSAQARKTLREWLPFLAAPAVALLVLVAIHAGLRWFVQAWYFLIAVPIAALFLALALEGICTWLESAREAGRCARYAVFPLLLASLVAILAAQVYESVDRWRPGSYVWQGDMLAAARWVREQTPESARIAGMNVGVVAYFGERRTTNLDGVVNGEAFEALKERELLAYVDQLDPVYVIDYDGYLFSLFRVFWGADIQARLSLVAEFSDAWEIPFRVYRFR